MPQPREDRESSYVSKLISFHWMVGWGLFLFFVTLPILTNLIIFFDPSILLLYIALFLGFGVFSYAYERRVTKLSYGFWLDLDRVDLKQSIQWVGYSVFSSLVGLSILHLFYFGLLLDIRYGINIFDEPGTFWPPVVLGVESAIMLPVTFLIFRHLDKKYENRRKWTGQFRITKKDLDKVLETSLGVLNLQYSEIAEGSKRRGLVPVLKIKGHDISIQVHESGSNSSGIVMTVRSPLDVSKALELQKEINSLIVVD